jgi:hypothetical protein
MRNHIDLVESLLTTIEEAPMDRLPFREQKQQVLDTLDRLLGCQDCQKSDKVAALREVQSAAKRMADQIERHLNQQSEMDGPRRTLG